MIGDAFLAIVAYIEQGGNVLYLIAIVTFLMWTLLIERFWYFQSEHKRVVLEASDIWEGRSERRSWSAHEIRASIISQTSARITGSLPIIQTCVALCPLLGLLGTVTGHDHRIRRHGDPGRQRALDGRWSVHGHHPYDVRDDRIPVRPHGEHRGCDEGLSTKSSRLNST